MAALGILLVYAIYGLIFLTGIILGWKIFTASTTKKKTWFAVGSLVCFTFLGFKILTYNHYYKEDELEFVGTYHLIKYPNCDSCEAILKEDNSFTVISTKTINKDKILEVGNWHFVAEGDFLGVYMDKKEKELLGSGRFDYSYYIDRNNKLIQAPKIGP